MILKPNKTECHNCNKLTKITSLYKLTWRYQDKTKKYKTSQRFITQTGYKYICKKCLTLSTK